MAKHPFAGLKAIIFDIGDTLVENRSINLSAALKAVEALMSISGKHGIPMNYLKFAGTAAERAFRLQETLYNHLPPEELDSQESAEFYVKKFSEELISLMSPESLSEANTAVVYNAFMGGVAAAGSLYPGTREVLTCLKAGYKTGIISNNPVEYVEPVLKHLDLYSLFDVVTISGREGRGIVKPLKEIFTRTLNALEVSPGEALMIGDSLANDIAGAREAGMLCGLINRKENLSAAKIKPDFVIHDIKELIDVLN
ncbi:MAG: HAD family hydrolase [Victivallaceae bacterium]|nr:HAD family hydrolase [Victivallaceae bacterium]